MGDNIRRRSTITRINEIRSKVESFKSSDQHISKDDLICAFEDLLYEIDFLRDINKLNQKHLDKTFEKLESIGAMHKYCPTCFGIDSNLCKDKWHIKPELETSDLEYRVLILIRKELSNRPCMSAEQCNNLLHRLDVIEHKLLTAERRLAAILKICDNTPNKDEFYRKKIEIKDLAWMEDNDRD